MTTVAVIPVRGTMPSKTRLGPILDTPTRQTLVCQMLSIVSRAVLAVESFADVWVITRNPEGIASSLPAGVRVIEQEGRYPGLNGSLQQAHRLAQAETFRDMLMLPADLPLATPAEIESFLMEDGDIVIAGDRDFAGTNGLRLPTRLAGEFHFAMGEGSFGHHRAESLRLGILPRTVYLRGLAYDVDTSADWFGLPESTRAALIGTDLISGVKHT